MMSNRIFALDIGTRSVTGLIIEQQQHTFSVVDYYMKEHEERSMLDGQIHNVIAVAQTVKMVKDKLEETNGPLEKVYVAAAGRTLKTMKATSTMKLNQQTISANETLKHLELEAIQNAQKQLVMDTDDYYANYYCVGYSVVQYMLDGEKIGSLIDQSGNEAAVEVIATFLPKVVIESLISVLERTDLQMEALTLEPIAAIEVLVPESMRRLNVVIVDIGAGTSDIAITKNGTILAYGMVPIAGDEITEAISDQYLLDFSEAEQAKRNIVIKGEHVIQNILGFEETIVAEQMTEHILPAVEKLAASIAEEILQLNTKAPQAIMLVGGGSLTPRLREVLANKLELPHNRVAIRSVDAIQKLQQPYHVPNQPDFITPIGIAIAAKQNPVHYINVRVNQKNVRMFELKQLTIGDCFIQAGISINHYYGKPGLAAMFQFNGQEMTIPGGFGASPRIYLNGERALVNSIIQPNDEIVIEKGADGVLPTVTIEEVAGITKPITVYYQQQPFELTPKYLVNDIEQSAQYVIQDKDDIVLKPGTLKEFIYLIDPALLKAQVPFKIQFNGKLEDLGSFSGHFTVNQQIAQVDQLLQDKDMIELTTNHTPTIKNVLDQLGEDIFETITVTFNEEIVTLQKLNKRILRNQAEVGLDEMIQRNDVIECEEITVEPFVFQDVFRYVDIDLTKVKGLFQIANNGVSTNFLGEIQDGDKLTITWN